MKLLMIKNVIAGSFLFAAMWASAQNGATVESEGEIQSLDFAWNKMVINGYEYDVATSVKVEINGSYGAFTMLEEGMLVEFSYLQFDDGVKRVTEVYEVDEVEEF